MTPSTLPLLPLPRLLVEPVVRAALLEDLGRAGDLTTDAIVPDDATVEAAIVARRPGVLAGLDAALLAFELLDPGLRIERLRRDGERIAEGEAAARVGGRARAILSAERVALNLLCRLSGVATATRTLVDAVAGHRAQIVCTRKTTPGLRALEKYAVRAGGGANHRFGLDDAILIKDNHVALAGGVRAAVERARRHAGHLVKIELEVDTLTQLEEALALGPDGSVDAVLLDNMDPATLRRAVDLVAGRAITEASGRITPETAPAVAAAGVDLISAGWITHSAPILDLGLDIGG
ncbi:MAG TPA: carboxylating nicotinate-nucleotide diphosphorylase [Stellaceae bacterium]